MEMVRWHDEAIERRAMTRWCDKQRRDALLGHRCDLFTLSSLFYRTIALSTVLRMRNWKEKWHQGVNEMIIYQESTLFQGYSINITCLSNDN